MSYVLHESEGAGACSNVLMTRHFVYSGGLLLCVNDSALCVFRWLVVMC